jgi:endoglucanase
VITRAWNSNVIRLPFNQDFVLRACNGRSGEEYQLALDQFIYWSSLFGAYTLLDLQWLDAERIYGGNRNFVAPLPNADSIRLWSMLARRYKDEPAVLYDLFTEPHDRLNDDPFPLNRTDGTVYPVDQRKVTMQDWQPWARTLTEAIRAENLQALVFVGGTNWAYDLRGMPMDIANLVYSTHVYSNKGDDWTVAFGNLAATVPVFVGEFGWTDTHEDRDFGRRLMQYMKDLELGWTAWSWFNDPLSIARYAATPFGENVRRQLTEA